MSAHVANLTSTGAVGRVRAFSNSASLRSQVDGISGAGASPARDQTERFDPFDRNEIMPRTQRYGSMFDGVVGFGSVLVSQEVGAAIMQAQMLYGHAAPPPAEAERQIANYEFAQSLMGPPEVMPSLRPFEQPAS